MSTDNVTPIRPPSGQPPKRTPQERKKKPEPQPDLSFSGGKGPSSATIWYGLRGVCSALEAIDGRINSDTVERYSNLSAAAAALSKLLEDRLML
jgi:hypothetical protein